MQTGSRRSRGQAHFGDNAAALRWQEAIQTAQHDLAEDLALLIGGDGLDRDSYLRWLAAENALCRTGAFVLESMAPTLASPALRQWADERTAKMRDWERMAAADVRRTDAIVAIAPVTAEPWRDFVERHRRQRPYRVLGAIALHEAVTGGMARQALIAVLERSFLPVRGCTYLLHRLLAADDGCDWRWLWQQADEGAQRRALCDGAWHAATLYRRIVQAALQGGSRLSSPG
jgi:hypothetical protein